MKARREDCRLKAVAIIEKAEKEDRFLTEDENKEVSRLEGEMKGWTDQIVRVEIFQKPVDNKDEKDDVDNGGNASKNEGEYKADENEEIIKDDPNKEEQRGFRTFGEQMMAVYRASTPAGKVDRRLTTRSASGLNETNPSDGGFLVQKDFVADLLM